MSESIKQIKDAIMAACDDAGRVESVEELGAIFTGLEEARAELKLACDLVQAQLLLSVTDDQEVSVGGKTLRVSYATPRKAWKHAELREVVMDRLTQLAIDPDTGEVNLTPRQAVGRILEFAHVDYWRAKQLKELDINPDRYCEQGEDKRTIRIED